MSVWPVCAALPLACQAPQPLEPEAVAPRARPSLEQEPGWEQESEWEARREVVLAEARTSARPWAGAYSRFDLFDCKVTLAVAPESGFAYSHSGCAGVDERNVGSVEREGDEVVLRPEWPSSQGWRHRLPERLTRVAWGDRTYLIEEGDLVAFCNAVNAGSEPRESIFGGFLLKAESLDERPAGPPDLPEPYRGHLLDRPIEARIAAVGAWTTDEQDPWTHRSTVTIDVGTRHGAFEGMRLLGGGVVDVWLEEVGLETSRGRIEACAEDPTTAAAPGTRLSTSSDVAYRWMVEGE